MATIDYTINNKLFQSSPESCWYACYCMLFDWKQQPASAIQDRIQKAGLDYKDFWSNGLPVEKYQDVARALGLSGFRRGYFRSLAENPDYLGDVLKSYGPFWCAFSQPSEHAVIVCGVDVAAGTIRIMNPTNDGQGNALEQKFKPTEFLRRLGSKEMPAAAQMFR